MKGIGNYTSYSGYLTVNQKYGSNTFFWFFPSQDNNPNAEVLLWLQGGPGSASMYGLFSENGPFKVDDQLNLYENEYTWNKNFSIIYIDNPVGAVCGFLFNPSLSLSLIPTSHSIHLIKGWSFTQSDFGYSTNEEEIGKNLYSAIYQFFQLFPELQENDFYVCGESYAGKYINGLLSSALFCSLLFSDGEGSTKKLWVIRST